MSEVTYTPKEECPYRYMDKCTPVLELEKIIAERDKETCAWERVVSGGPYDVYETQCGKSEPSVYVPGYCCKCGKRVKVTGKEAGNET